MKAVKLIASIVISFAAGAIGSLATISNISTWYAELEKPLLNPPNFVFGPVWTILYLLMGIALYLVWTSKATKSKTIAYAAFAAQLVLNALWSLVFFGLHSPELGILVIVLLIGGYRSNYDYFLSILKTRYLLAYSIFTLGVFCHLLDDRCCSTELIHARKVRILPAISRMFTGF